MNYMFYYPVAPYQIYTMAYNTGATFYPGGEDSYYMPEVVSPAPQRLAELPTNIEQNVAHMEYQAASGLQQQRISTSSLQTVASPQPSNYNTWSPVTPLSGQQASQVFSNHQTSSQTYQQTARSQSPSIQISDQPSFSPFPKIPNRGPCVPPTDDEREAILESAREAVLASDDFETQLTWAQDALTYVEVSIQNEQRISQTQAARPRTPRVEHMLKEDAMKVVEFLAVQHHPRAEFIKGMWLEFGKFGYRVDKREAFNCYKRSSEKGFARSYYRIGMQFENSNDALTAIKYYQQGVDMNDAASCYRLGMMTLLGQHGQVQDFQRGLQLIRLASDGADENAPHGAYILGMLQAGELIQVSMPESILPRDVPAAKVSVERSAFLGFAKAQVRMGTAYELGDLECPFDAALSLHYNALAARQGEADAELALSKWFLCGQEGVFAKNEELAFLYGQRAAVGGLGTAQFAMGYFYEVGIYVSMDLSQAREWYQKADESGNSDANKRIKDISRSKTISRKDHESVALQKIRQQHADTGGHQSMPSIQEATSPSASSYSTTIDMPDPSRLSLNTTPALQRPTSTAPYPTDGPGLTPHGSNNFRPTSAFGINPNLRTGSAMSAQSPNQRQDLPRLSSSPNQYQRPYANTNLSPVGQDYLRGGSPSANGHGYNHTGHLSTSPRPPPQHRPDSTSAYQSTQQHTSGHPPTRQDQPLPPTPAQSVLADIGFSAPLDEPRKRRPIPSQHQRPAPHKDSGHEVVSSDKHRHESSQTRPSRQRPTPQKDHDYQAVSPDKNRHDSSHLQPSRQENNKPVKPSSNRPSRTDAATPQPAPQKPAKVAASAAPSKPGKGPKTFEEMGVPPSKKESDCIVM